MDTKYTEDNMGISDERVDVRAAADNECNHLLTLDQVVSYRALAHSGLKMRKLDQEQRLGMVADSFIFRNTELHKAVVVWDNPHAAFLDFIAVGREEVFLGIVQVFDAENDDDLEFTESFYDPFKGETQYLGYLRRVVDEYVADNTNVLACGDVRFVHGVLTQLIDLPTGAAKVTNHVLASFSTDELRHADEQDCATQEAVEESLESRPTPQIAIESEAPMRDAILNTVSHRLLEIRDRNATKLDREDTVLMVADSFIFRNIDPRTPEKEWHNPLAKELDIIAVAQDEITLAIVRTFDAESDEDVPVVAAQHDPECDEQLVAHLQRIVNAYGRDKEGRRLIVDRDIQFVGGAIIDVIASPTKDVIYEHDNLASFDTDEIWYPVVDSGIAY